MKILAWESMKRTFHPTPKLIPVFAIALHSENQILQTPTQKHPVPSSPLGEALHWGNLIPKGCPVASKEHPRWRGFPTCWGPKANHSYASRFLTFHVGTEAPVREALLEAEPHHCHGSSHVLAITVGLVYISGGQKQHGPQRCQRESHPVGLPLLEMGQISERKWSSGKQQPFFPRGILPANPSCPAPFLTGRKQHKHCRKRTHLPLTVQS